MSNKPKWHCGTEDEHAYVQSIEGTFYALSIVSATNICDTLNRLEAERQEFLNANYTLQDRFRRLEAENAELRERLDAPRTATEGEQNGN